LNKTARTRRGSRSAWPLATPARRAMQVGFLSSNTPELDALLVTAFRRGLSETGYVEGQKVAIEYRWGAGQYNRLPEMAAALVRRQVAVIFAPGNIAGVLDAKGRPRQIYRVLDWRQSSRGRSRRQPQSTGGNLTGMTILGAELSRSGLEIFARACATAAVIYALINLSDPTVEIISKDLQAVAFSMTKFTLLPATTGKGTTQSLGSFGLPAARSDNFLDWNSHVPKTGLKLGDSVREVYRKNCLGVRMEIDLNPLSMSGWAATHSQVICVAGRMSESSRPRACHAQSAGRSAPFGAAPGLIVRVVQVIVYFAAPICDPRAGDPARIGCRLREMRPAPHRFPIELGHTAPQCSPSATARPPAPRRPRSCQPQSGDRRSPVRSCHAGASQGGSGGSRLQPPPPGRD
jgi:hypothetical protein